METLDFPKQTSTTPPVSLGFKQQLCTWGSRVRSLMVFDPGGKTTRHYTKTYKNIKILCDGIWMRLDPVGRQHGTVHGHVASFQSCHGTPGTGCRNQRSTWVPQVGSYRRWASNNKKTSCVVVRSFKTSIIFQVPVF